MFAKIMAAEPANSATADFQHRSPSLFDRTDQHLVGRHSAVAGHHVNHRIVDNIWPQLNRIGDLLPEHLS
ncbi:hypothetical protein [Mycobacterium uberis]|uniref:hypothetical protein n=1 Tax=Mycobacterium uberis TaxID=2162698 RepID=UPI000E30A85D|nr:hypothetical protein [Mycobacterium uberis]